MKINKIMIPVVASAMLLTGCDDQIMQWGKPANHADVTKAEIPIAVKEVIANYDNIKDYAQQYTPNMKIGIGMGADLYANNENGEGDLANANYQVFTPGNAMKNDAIMGNSGSLNFATVDKLLSALDGNMQLYGHNFFWHTQQNQTYLKSLIAPTLVVESDGDIANVLSGDASDFNGGSTGGWGSWGSNKESAEVVSGAGQDGSAALVLKNKGDGNAWEAQCAYTFNDYLEMNKTYVIKFKAKSTSPAGELQFQYQNGTTYSSQGGYNTFNVGTDWQTFQYEFTIDKYDDVNRIILNFGKIGATYTIDDIQFGLKQEDPMNNVLAGDASDFEGGTTGNWGSWGSNKESAEVEEGVGYNNSKALALKNKGDGNAWEAQCAYTFDDALQEGKKYIIQFVQKLRNSNMMVVLVANPTMISYLDNISWVVDEATKVGGVKLDYKFGVTTIAGCRVHVISTQKETFAKGFRLIGYPLTEEIITYRKYDYSFFIENNYRNVNTPLIPNVMVAQRYLNYEFLPLQSEMYFTEIRNGADNGRGYVIV